MAIESQDITVHTVSFARRGGPVFYASLPGDDKTCNGRRTNRVADKNRLASILIDHVVAMENPHWQYRQWCDSVAPPIHVTYSPLGRPQLLMEQVRGPAISFSEGGGKVWAALCGDESNIGIDAASTDEFRGEYPLYRVFHDQELHHALRLTGGDVEHASALLWSVKEAAVKALGCAFHLVAPLQVHVYQSEGRDSGYIFPVRVSRKTLLLSSPGAGLSIWVRSYPLEEIWLSIALSSGLFQWGDGEDFKSRL